MTPESRITDTLDVLRSGLDAIDARVAELGDNDYDDQKQHEFGITRTVLCDVVSMLTAPAGSPRRGEARLFLERGEY